MDKLNCDLIMCSKESGRCRKFSMPALLFDITGKILCGKKLLLRKSTAIYCIVQNDDRIFVVQNDEMTIKKQCAMMKQ